MTTLLSSPSLPAVHTVKAPGNHRMLPEVMGFQRHNTSPSSRPALDQVQQQQPKRPDDEKIAQQRAQQLSL